jgi:hypothetical protein
MEFKSKSELIGLPPLSLSKNIGKIDKPISLLKDKDKLIIVGYVYIKDTPKDRGIRMINSIKEYLENSFDDTVKVLVMPVLSAEKQGIEVLNPVFADNNFVNMLNENYEKILKLLAEKSSKNE